MGSSLQSCVVCCAVLCVRKSQLDEAQPGAQYVVTLTSDIQTVDQLLSSFHEWTGREMVDLQQQVGHGMESGTH